MTESLSQEELQEIYVFALDLGRRAGKLLLDGVDARCGAVEGRETKKAEEKMNAVDIVTQTDLGMLLFLERSVGKKGEEHVLITGSIRRRSICQNRN
jgi:myo-inositol-1(or 4)-monophosphatase